CPELVQPDGRGGDCSGQRGDLQGQCERRSQIDVDQGCVGFRMLRLQGGNGLEVRPLQNVQEVVAEEPRDDHADDDREYRDNQPVSKFPQMLEEGYGAGWWGRRRLEPLQAEVDGPALDRQRHGGSGRPSRASSVGMREKLLLLSASSVGMREKLLRNRQASLRRSVPEGSWLAPGGCWYVAPLGGCVDVSACGGCWLPVEGGPRPGSGGAPGRGWCVRGLEPFG